MEERESDGICRHFFDASNLGESRLVELAGFENCFSNNRALWAKNPRGESRLVELAGVEPASKQGPYVLSTRLSRL